MALTDADGIAWSLIDKAPIFDAADVLRTDSKHPILLSVACNVLDERIYDAARQLAVIDLLRWSITYQIFVEMSEQLETQWRSNSRALVAGTCLAGAQPVGFGGQLLSRFTRVDRDKRGVSTVTDPWRGLVEATGDRLRAIANVIPDDTRSCIVLMLPVGRVLLRGREWTYS